MVKKGKSFPSILCLKLPRVPLSVESTVFVYVWMPEAGSKWNSAFNPCSIDQRGLKLSLLCWWGTGGEAVGNVWDTWARQTLPRAVPFRFRLESGKDETPPGRKSICETPGAADTGAGEPRGAETACSTRPESKKTQTNEKKKQTNDKCKAAWTKLSALKCRVACFSAAY